MQHQVPECDHDGQGKLKMVGYHIWAVRTGERDPLNSATYLDGQGQVPHLPSAAEAGDSKHVDALVGLAEFG